MSIFHRSWLFHIAAKTIKKGPSQCFWLSALKVVRPEVFFIQGSNSIFAPITNHSLMDRKNSPSSNEPDLWAIDANIHPYILT